MHTKFLVALAIALASAGPALSVTAASTPETAPFLPVGATVAGDTSREIGERLVDYQYVRIPLLYDGDEFETRGRDRAYNSYCTAPLGYVEGGPYDGAVCSIIRSTPVSLKSREYVREGRRFRLNLLAFFNYATAGPYRLTLRAIHRRALVGLALRPRIVPGATFTVPVRRGDGVSAFHGAPLHAQLWIRNRSGDERIVAQVRALRGRLSFDVPAAVTALGSRLQARVVVLGTRGVLGGETPWRALA